MSARPPVDRPPLRYSGVGGLRDGAPLTITAARLRPARLALADMLVELNMMINECEDLARDARADQAGELVRVLADDLSAAWVAGMRAYARLRSLAMISEDETPDDLAATW